MNEKKRESTQKMPNIMIAVPKDTQDNESDNFESLIKLLLANVESMKKSCLLSPRTVFIQGPGFPGW
jgi:hypothetical protein